jgi:hypothetical protein
LSVVESGDRATPSQAIAVYNQSSPEVKAAIAEWSHYKTDRLPQLNRKLVEEHLAPVAISKIEQGVEYLMSR